MKKHLHSVVIVPLRLQNNNQISPQIRDVELASVVCHEPGTKVVCGVTVITNDRRRLSPTERLLPRVPNNILKINGVETIPSLRIVHIDECLVVCFLQAD